MQLLAILGLVFLVVGTLMNVYALKRYRTETAPSRPTMKVRYWKPVWKTQDWFTSRKGYMLYVAGAQLLALGGLVTAIYFIVR